MNKKDEEGTWMVWEQPKSNSDSDNEGKSRRLFEAIQLTSENWSEVFNFVKFSDRYRSMWIEHPKGVRVDFGDGVIQVMALQLSHPTAYCSYVLENDYIIKGINGEFYPCKPDIFKANYTEL